MFTREEELDAELNIDEETLNEKYEGRLDKKYESATYQVVSSVFRGLTAKKLTAAGSFQAQTGHPGIRCNLKAVQGELYLLEKSLFFVAKQPTLIDFADIHMVTFSRLGGGMASARTIDLGVVTREGPELTFTNINKEEHDGIETFLRGKKVRTKNEMADEMVVAAVDLDSDEDMQSVVSDGEDERAPRTGGGDDEDSEEDDDFEASGSDAGSPSASDSDSEGAASASDASGDRDLMGKNKKAKAKAKAKAKDSSPGSSPPKKKKKASQDDDSSPPKKKPAPKPKKKKDDAMDVDESPRPKPKPKPKPKKDDDEGPAKKKQKRD